MKGRFSPHRTVQYSPATAAGKRPLSIVEEYLESPAQMLEALDNRYRGATTTDIILSLSESHKVFSEENDMSKFLDELRFKYGPLRWRL
jgi:hypothetical protein